MLVVGHAVLLPWALRNAGTLGRFTPFNLVGGVGVFMANNPTPPASGTPGTSTSRNNTPA